jgi:putative hydrolase of the HAD superfamily
VERSDRRWGLRAVLFDSGGVLMQPKGGRWNPRVDFEEVVSTYAPSVTEEQFARAIALGDRFLDESTTTPDYVEYHRVILGHLGVEARAELLGALDRPIEVTKVLETFPEVLGVLRELRRRGVRMAVVSDAWPDLPDLHEALRMGDFFEVYAISAVLGCNKPDPRMYRHASDGLGLEPSECVFVDDGEELVAAAIELGYVGRVVRRASTPTSSSVPSIAAIDELLDLF